MQSRSDLTKTFNSLNYYLLIQLKVIDFLKFMEITCPLRVY